MATYQPLAIMVDPLMESVQERVVLERILGAAVMEACLGQDDRVVVPIKREPGPSLASLLSARAVRLAGRVGRSESKVFVWSEGELLDPADLTPRQVEDAVRMLRSIGKGQGIARRGKDPVLR